MTILICLCVAAFLLLVLTEAARLRPQQQAENVSPVFLPENGSTPSDGNSFIASSGAPNITPTSRGRGFNLKSLLSKSLGSKAMNSDSPDMSSTDDAGEPHITTTGIARNNPTALFSAPFIDKESNNQITTLGSDETTITNHISSRSDSEFVLPLLDHIDVSDDVKNNTGSKNDYGKDTHSENSGSVPLMSFGLELPKLDVTHENDTKTSKKCSNYLCKLKSCKRYQTCVMDPECTKARCVNSTLHNILPPTTTPTAPPAGETILRPLSERSCGEEYGIECKHGVISNCSLGDMTCLCDKGWDSWFCDKPCTLECVHGNCDIFPDKSEGCVCEFQYTGKWCDVLIPDPEEDARVLAAILSSVLAAAILLTIAIPVIMWKMRALLILKLVYYFKEYEDDDGKIYDAYVSMTPTSNAERFVYGSLQPVLENSDFKLFLHARNAPAGEAMSETILSALEGSRRTIMIVTRDYITNEWNRFEYLIAQHETLKLKQRIIPIILEDIEKEEVNMDKSLKHILSSIKCLKFPHAKQDMTLNVAELSENIQSPDSNMSVGSTNYFCKTGRSSSNIPTSKKEQKFENKVAKFWKHLMLTMPKKKSKKSHASNTLAKLINHDSYDVNKRPSEYISDIQFGNKEYNKIQPILEFNTGKTSVNKLDGEKDKLDIQIMDLYKSEHKREVDGLRDKGVNCPSYGCISTIS